MKLLTKRLRADAGFTLVELMVVVAIIGLLSAVAIPNFKKYQAKAKTSEAKLQLAAAYSAETSWFSDYDAFSSCLNLMGFDPAVEYLNRYYAVGFVTAQAANGINGYATTNGANASCAVGDTVNNTSTVSTSIVSTYAWGAGKKVAGALPMLASNIAAQTPTATLNAVDASGFTVGAVGVISPDKTTAILADGWTINDIKRVVQIRTGY